MQLAQVLDVVEGLLVAGRHPDIAAVERFGHGGEPWGPTVERSKSTSITGVSVRYQSSATASLWGASWPGETPIEMPAEMPPPVLRAARLPIFVIQLLDVARPAAFRTWQLVALAELGADRGKTPGGVSIVGADGTKMLLRSTSTGPTLGFDPTDEPFPDYRIPDEVASWQQAGAAPAAGS